MLLWLERTNFTFNSLSLDSHLTLHQENADSAQIAYLRLAVPRLGDPRVGDRVGEP